MKKFGIFMAIFALTFFVAGCKISVAGEGKVELIVHADTEQWGKTYLCSSSKKVPSPKFTLENLPGETKYVSVSMRDLSYKNYDHGTSIIEFSGGNDILEAAFSVIRPCNRKGPSVHRYEFKVNALNAKKDTVAQGKAIVEIGK